MAPKTARSGSPKKGGDGGKKTSRSKSPRPGDGDKSKSGKGGKTKRAASAGKQRKGEDKAEKASASADASAEVAAVVEEELAPKPGGRRRPKPEMLKTVTTGAVGVVDFIEEDDAEVKGEPTQKQLPGGAAATADEEGSGPPKMAWSCEKWLGEITTLMGCVSSALCTEVSDKIVFEDDAALAHVRALDSEQDLLDQLRNAGLVEKLAKAIWPKLEVLKAGPATASELATQWASEGAGDLLFGGLPSFFSGLEPRIGSPDPKVLKDMMADHCSKPDSQVEFTTGNYSVVTTSEVEWKFVYEPDTPLKWPLEERLMNDEKTKHHMRKLLPVEVLQKRMDAQNKLLEALGADQLQLFEVVGGRLYTGPLFVKYNGVLRGLDSPIPFLKNAMIQLCCSKDVSERFLGESKLWQPAAGTLPYEKAKKEINLYTTTIHVINSCIVKMGKLTKAKPVYRGLSLRILPEQFWKPNEQGVMGGVEFAFMSTTPDRSVAEQYSQDGFGIIVEIQQGMMCASAMRCVGTRSPLPCPVPTIFLPR
jgi:hypothetical protein